VPSPRHSAIARSAARPRSKGGISTAFDDVDQLRHSRLHLVEPGTKRILLAGLPPFLRIEPYILLRIDPSKESKFSIRRNPPIRDRKKIDPGTQFRQNPSLEIAEFP
jgi:hypothetical protein